MISSRLSVSAEIVSLLISQLTEKTMHKRSSSEDRINLCPFYSSILINFFLGKFSRYHLVFLLVVHGK